MERRHKKHVPSFRLKGTTGQLASLSTAKNERIPVMLTDVQHLLLHSLLGNLNLTQAPRWYVLDKSTYISQTTCLVLEGLSLEHWESNKSSLVYSSKRFENYVELLTPAVYGGSLVDELALVPLTESEKESLILSYGSMNLALEARKDLNVMIKAVFPVQNNVVDVSELCSEDKYPRTQLILSAWQLVEENYPVPLKGKLQMTYSDYIMSKDIYKPVSAKSPMFGLDCEMCMTSAGSELTRVSIVNEKHETVYESLVKPYNDITDYLTRYSGVTKSMLENVSKRLEDVQKDLQTLLPPDAILIGQSLNVDLHALKLMHPYVIDTSLVFNFTGERNRKPKLKTLAKEFLKEDIQTGKNGHCSVEDALAAIKLVQLKLSQSIEFGDAVHTNREKYKQNVIKMADSPQYALSIFNRMIDQKISSIVIGCDNITGDYHTYLTKAKESLSTHFKKVKTKNVKLKTVDNKEDVISSLCDSIKDYNFVMAHLKFDINVDNESKEMERLDKWIETIWQSLRSCSLFVVVYGGTTVYNGVAMMHVKNL